MIHRGWYLTLSHTNNTHMSSLVNTLLSIVYSSSHKNIFSTQGTQCIEMRSCSPIRDLIYDLRSCNVLMLDRLLPWYAEIEYDIDKTHGYKTLLHIWNYLQIQSVPHRKHYVSATKPNWLMLFRETVAAYCENRTEHKRERERERWQSSERHYIYLRKKERTYILYSV
jgi:hypothetical protein